MRRREFLAAAAAVAGAATTGGPARAAESVPESLETWDDVRAQFALDPSVLQLTSFLLASHPKRVRDAIERHGRGLDRDPRIYLEEHEGELENAVRARAAAYLGANADEVALTDSTTMGIALLYAGLRVRPGEEILTTTHDFYATHEALRFRAQRDGVRVRRIPLYRDVEKATADEIVQSLRTAVGPRTRYVALTWVHSSTGLKLPIRRIREALPARVLVCVDGVHGFGVENVDVARLGCDFFASGCHKWLFGPRGTGILWARAREASLLSPTIPSFDGASYGRWLGLQGPPAPAGQKLTPGGFHSFEHRWALADAFDFHRALGRTKVARRTHALAGRFKQGLAAIPGVRVKTPVDPALSAGLVCFEHPRLDPAAAVQQLYERFRIVASVTPYATRYIRVGPSIVNDEAEVDRAVRAVAALR